MGPTPHTNREPRRVAPAAPVRSAQVLSTSPSIPDLGGLVAHYQALLRLRDWQLDVSYVPNLTDSQGRQVWGLCEHMVDAKFARLQIRDPKTPPPGESFESAVENVIETVIHELVHLHFAPFDNRTPAEIAAEEQAVWALAPAIARARGTSDEGFIARAMLALAPKSTASAVARKTEKSRMALDPKQSRDALKILIAKDQKSALAFLEKLVVGEEEPGSEPAGEGSAPPAAAAAVPPPEEEDKQALARAAVDPDGIAALGRTALVLTGKSDPNEAMLELARMVQPAARAAAAAPPPAVEPPAAPPVDPDAVERRALVARLVQINVETPATAWADSTATAPAKRLADEPIASLRSRVATLESTLPKPAQIAPPSGATGPTSSGARRFMTTFGEVEISAREIAKIRSRKTNPEEQETLLQTYAENKAGNERARGVRTGG